MTEFTSLRATVISANGARITFASDAEPAPFTLRAMRRRSELLASLVGREVDVTVTITRDDSGRIVEGSVCDVEVVEAGRLAGIIAATRGGTL